MQYLATDKQLDLLRSLTRNLELHALLDLLGQEIESLHVADGYIIDLCDAPRENLRCLKLRYLTAFRYLESTYYGYKTNLQSEHFLPNAQAFVNRQVLRLHSESASSHERTIVKNWKLEEYVVLPFIDTAFPEQASIGTVSLMKEQGRVDDAKIAVLNELLSLFHAPIQAAIQTEFLTGFHQQFASAAQEHARALQFIVEVGNLTNRQNIFDMFTAELFKRFRFDCIGFFLLEDHVLKNQLVSVSGPDYRAIEEEWIAYFSQHHYGLALEGGVSHAFMKNLPLVFPDVQKIMHLPMSDNDKVMLRIVKTPRTLMVLPICYQGKPIGVMTLFSLSDVVGLSEADVHLLKTLSAFFGTALTNADNFAARERQSAEIERLNLILQNRVVELSEQAEIDRLTGLYNFRSFEREIDVRISECRRSNHNESLAMVIFDVDHFKRFNDTYGHAAGNQILAGVARELLKLVRQMDMAFRFGGEEFVVMMSRCTLEGSKIFAERVRKAIEDTSFDTEAGALSVTISAGCATYLKNDTQEAFFRRADHALYQAKKNGRNRVEG